MFYLFKTQSPLSHKMLCNIVVYYSIFPRSLDLSYLIAVKPIIQTPESHVLPIVFVTYHFLCMISTNGMAIRV